MSELTEAEKETLEEEKVWCRENIKYLNEKLSIITDTRNSILNHTFLWKERYERADRKLAFDTKLIVIEKGKEKKESVVRSLEKILEDKDKLKEFIKLRKMMEVNCELS